jgi:hypothetical protein
MEWQLNSIDSDQYVDGSIDLEHISSESVDEDNLSIYLTQVLTDNFLVNNQATHGGLTWADSIMKVKILFPMVRLWLSFQASAAPAGWTQVTSQNDKVLRVVSGTGGGTGGDLGG